MTVVIVTVVIVTVVIVTVVLVTVVIVRADSGLGLPSIPRNNREKVNKGGIYLVY